MVLVDYVLLFRVKYGMVWFDTDFCGLARLDVHEGACEIDVAG